MEQIQKRKIRIEILLTLVVISGLVWFMKFGAAGETSTSINKTEVASVAAVRPQAASGPKPESFETFSIPGFEEIYRDIRCADVLYTVLIFPKGLDYRYSSREAVYNTATSCEKGKSVEFFLREAGLKVPAGEYYLVVADQGASGGWYNPR